MGGHDEQDGGGARARLGALVRQLIDQRGTSRHGLEARTGLDRRLVSKAAAGTTVPSENTARLLDEALGAGGRIVGLRAQAHAEKQADRLREAEAVADRHDDRQEPEGVDGTDRREFFELGAAGLFAAEIYRRRARSGPDMLTLGEIEDAVNRHATVFTTAGHEVLAADVFRTWRSAEKLIDTGPKARSLVKLTLAAGYSAYMLSRLAFNLGDAGTSRRFVALAADHSGEVGDPVLAGSVAAMDSTLAFYSHRYQEAADVARRAAAAADHPYTRARLAAYEARALAALGDATGTRAALDRMRRAVVDLPPQPGSSPFSPATADSFFAGILARLGSGTEAEPLARNAVAAFDGGRAIGFEDHGHALMVLATTLLHRDRPEPEEAAELCARALELLADTPTHTVFTRAGRLAGELAPYRSVPAVANFAERLEAAPRPPSLTGA